MTIPDFHRVMPEGDLAEGRMHAVEIAGRDVLVCRSREGVHAVDNVCTHAYARLHEGRLRGFRVICPLHGAAFDCRTGGVLGAPATAPLPAHQVRIAEGWIEVALAT
jgi:nitrite reductase/ring-hydroxylating ferredoxin subunit